MSSSENNEINNLRRLAMTKRLNFLIGSGASKPAIPLMSEFSDKAEKTANQQLTQRIISISKIIENNSYLKNDRCNIFQQTDLTLKNYRDFIEKVVHILNLSNSRETPRSANIFTTNYDLFIEKAVDEISRNNRLIFNDGAKGYLTRYLDSSNYNQVVSYKGLNDNYISEIPSISLIKPHGSVNWVKKNEDIVIDNKVSTIPVIVEPNGLEGQETFLNNHFHEMLRVFQLELDKPQSVLFVLGFSFQDKHIGKMIKRALKNPELMIYVFGFVDSDRKLFLDNLGFSSERSNFIILTPENFDNELLTKNDGGKKDDESWYSFTLPVLSNILSTWKDK
ncbi:hypothetical protein BCR24_15775 [Enterococcus ureilyticus]|uniref:Uncharacterized protein n=1 Tax=Enterococcus ureilyticus TaxID=1131292 RepID=A0A1E5HBS0_9ENTE|nr:SIR2 family protein [Enterococcus ureilyticus]MBM7690549.1 hypothetical protein [Enterococcus ureilyticus]OEG22402.1 hypothetical protein BCR24_15775 [Enterococcus ureilyticus]